MSLSAQKLQGIITFLSQEMENTINVGVFLEKEKICWDEELLHVRLTPRWLCQMWISDCKSSAIHTSNSFLINVAHL